MDQNDTGVKEQVIFWCESCGKQTIELTICVNNREDSERERMEFWRREGTEMLLGRKGQLVIVVAA